LIENIFGAANEAVTIYSTKRVLANVKRHLFNNDTWPDFSRIPNHIYPSVRFVEITAGVPFTIGGLAGGDLTITPIPVNHIVPTVGLLMQQAHVSIGFTSDTGPTEAFWEQVNQTGDLAAVITECSFPNRLQAVADVSLHLTPATLAVELAKLRPGPRVHLYHLKPPYLDEIRAELAETPLPVPVEELEQDRVYFFE
jgi:cAMP phosphodiesterase